MGVKKMEDHCHVEVSSQENFDQEYKPHIATGLYYCHLFLLLMGCTGAGDVVAIAQCQDLHWIVHTPLVAKRKVAIAILQCERALRE